MLSAEDSRIWNAMDIGPQWILRETEDVSLPQNAIARALASSQGGTAPAAPARRAPAPAPARPAAPPPAALRRAVSAPSRPAQPSGPAAPAVQGDLTAEQAAAAASADWDQLAELAEHCRCCAMGATRQHMVFAEGRPGPKLALVGEAPGSEEDLQGIPFVGKSGRLLTQMLLALNIVRKKDIVILNVLKCRPPANRNPQPQEMLCCSHYLRRQLELIAPSVIFIMGRFAAQELLGLTDGFSIGSLRGRVHTVEYAPGKTARAVVSYHPSYLLRSPDQKAKAWDDLLLLKHVMHQAGIDMPAQTKRWN
jgi:uracil-DNA glycosylase family 4